MTAGARMVCVALASMITISARADEPAADPRAQADAQYHQAEQFFGDGDYVAAAVMFDEAARAYAALGDADARKWQRISLSNEATSYAQAGRPVEAAATFKRLRAEFAAEMTPEQLEATDAAIARLEAQIGEAVLVGAPEGALVRLDGLALPAASLAAPLRLGAGDHVLDVEAPTYRPWSTRFVVVGTQRTTVTIEMVSLQAPARIRIEASVGSASVTLDGKPLGEAPVEVTVEPGAHRWTVASEGYAGAAGEVVAVPGERAIVRAGLTWRRSPTGVRAESYGAFTFPLRLDTPFGEYGVGLGVRVFPEWLRFRSVRFGVAGEVHGREVNFVELGVLVQWCPDFATWEAHRFAWCPLQLAGYDVRGSSADFGEGNQAGRAITSLEWRPSRTMFLRAGAGLGLETYDRDVLGLLFLWTSNVELTLGIDL